MKRYLLDNSVLVAYLKGRPGALRLIQHWVIAREVATSYVVYGEAIEYIRGDRDFLQRRRELRKLLREITPLQVTYAILERYADLRRTMRLQRGLGLIGDMDTLIASTALVYDLTVVTLDSDFTRVPDLSVMRLDRASRLA